MIKISEIIIDEYFIDRVHTNLQSLLQDRRTREEPKVGYSYKRDWYDRLSEDQLNTEYFIQNISDIWYKKSNLNSLTRMVIKHICDKSYLETVNHYNEIKAHETQINPKDGPSCI